MTACGCGGFDCGGATEHDEVSHRHVDDDARLHTFEGGQHTAELLGVVDVPAVLRSEADAATVGPTVAVTATVCGFNRSGRTARMTNHTRRRSAGRCGTIENQPTNGGCPCSPMPHSSSSVPPASASSPRSVVTAFPTTCPSGTTSRRPTEVATTW